MATNIRIIPSEEEASLHPRAIWNHWQKNVIWDPRSYYGFLEFSGALTSLITFQGGAPSGWYAAMTLFSCLMLVVPIAALHWYSNARQSTSILTRSRTHIGVLLSVAAIISISSIISITTAPACSYYCGVPGPTDILLWISITIRQFPANSIFLFLLLTVLIVSYVVYRNARNPRKDPILAELPSPIDLDYPGDEGGRVWAASTIADGIDDDSPEPEGQLRL